MPRHIISAVVHDGAAYTDCDLPLPWWSFTKTVLAATALTLVAQDRLSLDEPVRGRPFTLRHLLQHQAGLPDYGSLAAYHKAVEASELPWPPEELMERVQADTDCDLPLPWWSFTKTVLAATALTLVAQDRLSLDEPVRGRPFTLRHLLQHQAGLPDYGSLAAYHKAVEASELPWPPEELMERVQADTLIFEPGGGWGYSNVGYLLVRGLIEDATGEALDQALKRLTFDPLGIGGIKIATTPDELKYTAWGNVSGYHPGWVCHGLLLGTASSAALFLDRLLAGYLLPASLLAAMLEAHPLAFVDPERPWKTTSYGLGLMIGMGEPPGWYIGHTGGGPGSTSAVYRHASEHSTDSTRRTAAAFAQLDAPGAVERHAMVLAHSPSPPGHSARA